MCGSLVAILTVAACGVSSADPSDRPGSTSPDSTAPPSTKVAPDPADIDALAVTDNTQRIRVDVPAAWAEIDGAPSGDASTLIASTDVVAFFTTFSTTGMFIETAAAEDGDSEYRVFHENSSDSYGEAGCEKLGTVDYDDGFYVGSESRFDCTPGKTTTLISGTNASRDLVFNVGFLLDDDDTTTRQIIVDSFIVSLEPI